MDWKSIGLNSHLLKVIGGVVTSIENLTLQVNWKSSQKETWF